jgi:hypothetical protein
MQHDEGSDGDQPEGSDGDESAYVVEESGADSGDDDEGDDDDDEGDNDDDDDGDDGDNSDDGYLSVNGDSLKAYVVEAILDKDTIRKKVHYLVKWVGHADATWEQSKVISGQVPDMVKKYNNDNKERK